MRPIDADKYREEFRNSREFEPMKMLDMQTTLNVVPIPEDATNGDVLCSLFSVKVLGKDNTYVCVEFEGFFQFRSYPRDWWEAKFKKKF